MGLSYFLRYALRFLFVMIKLSHFNYQTRFIEGVGSAAIYGAMISIFMTLYPKNFVKILSWTETTFGLGYSLGPAIGVFIYDLGGFKLPFIVVGSVDLVFAITIIFLIPGMKQVSNSCNC